MVAIIMKCGTSQICDLTCVGVFGVDLDGQVDVAELFLELLGEALLDGGGFVGPYAALQGDVEVGVHGVLLVVDA